jgi:hypothetical protein
LEEALTACWTRELPRKADENAETDDAIKKRVEARRNILIRFAGYLGTS